MAQKRYIFISSGEGPTVISSDGWKLRYHKGLKKFRLHYLPNDSLEEKILNKQYPNILNELKSQLKKNVKLDGI